MLPIPTSRVFRSRRGALIWSFWVIVSALLTVGALSGDGDKSGPTDATGANVDQADVAAIAAAFNAN